ncbi:MAG: gamma carbonic anhydrase family protein [Rhizobiaceae bacterium]|nr:gamma carbonic anhydrase family protein [Hyphomicrobiales bacterium]NRB31229.1 gamma carbonic anhydrase family protein [Rhizobiaceae bacterium]
MPIYELDGVSPDLAGQTTPNDNCWVAPCATLIGKVTLHQDANIWFGAVLRGDNEEILVGEGSNVQELCSLHTDMGYPLTIGRNCTIGHKAIIHGCTIGDGSLVGMGATVMNGAVIGKNCLVGAGALVAEGKKIPDGSLVLGAPGKVLKTLDEKAQQQIAFAAKHYVQNSRRFRAGLKLVK